MSHETAENLLATSRYFDEEFRTILSKESFFIADNYIKDMIDNKKLHFYSSEYRKGAIRLYRFPTKKRATKILVEFNININTYGSFKRAGANFNADKGSVLRYFCSCLEHVKLLVEKYGINPAVNDNYIFHRSVHEGNFDVADYLLTKGCTYETKISHAGVYNKLIESRMATSIEYLLKLGYDPNVPHFRGTIDEKNAGISGVTPYRFNRETSPLEIAMVSGYIEGVELFIRYGAKLTNRFIELASTVGYVVVHTPREDEENE